MISRILQPSFQQLMIKLQGFDLDCAFALKIMVHNVLLNSSLCRAAFGVLSNIVYRKQAIDVFYR